MIFVAVERGERVLGYAYGRLEPRDWNELLDACGKLHDLYVDEDARGHGAASALVEAVVARLEAKARRGSCCSAPRRTSRRRSSSRGSASGRRWWR